MHSEELEIGYLVRPFRGTHPGVVKIHDVWGLSDHTRDMAQRLAGEGFAVLAVDLYRRDPVEISDPGSHMRGLSDPAVLEDVQAAVDALVARPETQGRRAGVVGFCMGGMYALMAGCSCHSVAAAEPFYGLLSHDHGILHGPSTFWHESGQVGAQGRFDRGVPVGGGMGMLHAKPGTNKTYIKKHYDNKQTI